jgi:hypothetical protein
MDCGMSSPVRYGAAPSHLPSRTMKRLRDNRPSEEVIHREYSNRESCVPSSVTDRRLAHPTENTLRMLYSAQQQQDNQMPPQHQDQTSRPPTIDRAFSSQPATPSSSGTPVQRSLHAFWNIPSAASMPNILPPTGMDHRAESQEE